MKHYLHIPFALLFFFSTSLYAQQKLSPTEAQMEDLFGDWTDDTKPGLALCVLNDGKIEFQKNWGLANVEHGIEIENETVFLFPDMSEQMLAFSILLLVDREELSMDEQLGANLDFLPAQLQELTIEDLLHHRTGLIPMNFVKTLAGHQNHTGTTKPDLINLLDKKMATAGTLDSYDYSRAGLRLLQMILEKKTKSSFANFAQKEIFAPLQMKSSSIAPPGQSIPHKAQGYVKNEEGFQTFQEPTNYLACDQLYTTSYDLCLWADNFWRPKIGHQKIWQQMDQLMTSEGEPLEMKNTAQYVGQHRYWNYLGESKLYQIGMTRSFAAKLIRYPKHDLAVVVLGNFGEYNGHLATGCSQFYLQPFLADPPTAKEQPTFLATNQLDLDQYCGNYWDYKNESGAVVSFENDTLFYTHLISGWKIKLENVADDQFYLNRRSGYDVAIDTEEGELTLSIPGQKPKQLIKVPVNSDWQAHVSEIAGHYHNQELAMSHELVVNKEGITLQNKRAIDISFKPLTKDTYTSTDLYYSRINVDRDPTGMVTGIRISNPKLKDILFEKQGVQ